jgi:hypothetical protein
MTVTEKNFQPVQMISVMMHQDAPALRLIGFGGTLCADGARALGVTDLKWISECYASIITLGIALIEITGDCLAGDDIMSGANGIGKKATTGAIVCGRALDACSGGGVIRIKLVP